jgi:hypothetical protein
VAGRGGADTSSAHKAVLRVITNRTDQNVPLIVSRVAYNNARPLAFQDDNIFRLGRGILQHPLSNIYDSRFVISVEFQACRSG